VCIGEIAMLPELLSPMELLALAKAIRDMDVRDPGTSWSDALYLPKFSVAVSTIRAADSEDHLEMAVSIITGGVRDRNLSASQIHAINRWITIDEIEEIFDLLGINQSSETHRSGTKARPPVEFTLPGRPGLEEFFREYVIDHYWRKDKYDALGVKPPGGILLHGPPGTGKSYAVKTLAEFLGWPVFDIDMGTVGSPYIHQTSVVLRRLFETAFEKAPSLILIDEVDAFAGDRSLAGQDHKVEEISEFLRLIEAASERGVIVVATTNRKDAIDEAMRRKGRFDHIVEVDYPEAEEIATVLESLLADRPHVGGMNLVLSAEKLGGRPMSDIAWAVNEAARTAVKSQKDEIDDICLFQAISRLPT
jgi:ATP-dependent 26S proteasome regulatory subunit